MAKLDTPFLFTGSLGNVSAYTMRGTDKIILRTKGGATKQMIKTAPQFEMTRLINAEFGGRAKAGSLLLQSISPMKALADHNLSGPVNALLKPVQAMDTEHGLGQRSILFSRGAHMLSGYNLNRQYPFDGIVRTPVTYGMDAVHRSASLEIPEMLPGINFHVPGRYAYFGLIVVLGMVPDLHHGPAGYAPAGERNSWPPPVIFYSAWYPVSKGSPGLSVLLEQTPPPDNGYGLVLSIGIRFGAPGDGGNIEQVKWAGSARLLLGKGSVG